MQQNVQDKLDQIAYRFAEFFVARQPLIFVSPVRRVTIAVWAEVNGIELDTDGCQYVLEHYQDYLEPA